MKDLQHYKYISPFQPDYLEGRQTYWLERFPPVLQRRASQLATSPRDLATQAALAMHERQFGVTKRFLSLAGEVAAAVCVASFRTGDVSFTYGGVPMTGPGAVPEIVLSPTEWRTSFDLVILSRRPDLIRAVLDYPEEYLRRDPGERDEYGFTLVETMRAFGLGQARWKDLALETERNMEPERIRIAPANWLAMERGRLGLMRAIDTGSAAELDAALVAMIKAHKAYYGRGAEAKKPGGLLCLPALAFAAMAHDRGIRTSVVSDYMPLWLVRGEDPPA